MKPLRWTGNSFRLPLVVALLAVCATATAQTAPPATPTPSTPAPSAPAPSAPAPSAPTAEPPAAAEPSLEDQASRWNRTLERLEKQLADKSITIKTLESLRQTVQIIARQARRARQPIAARAASVQTLIDELGPLPKKDQPPENAETTRRRAVFNKQIEPFRKQLQLIDVVLSRTAVLNTQVTSRRQDALREALFLYGPSLWQGRTWSRAWNDLRTAAPRLLEVPSIWWNEPRVREAIRSGRAAIVVAIILVVLVLGLLLRRFLRRRFGRRDDEDKPSQARRFGAAVVEAVSDGLLPILLLLATYLTLQREGLLADRADDLAQGLLIGISFFVFARALAIAGLSPTRPEWRLHDFPDGPARTITRLVVALAVVIGMDLGFRSATRSEYFNREFLAVYGLFVNTLYAFVIFRLLRRKLWLVTEEASTPALWAAVRLLGQAMCLAIPLAALIGYRRLAHELALDLGTTMVILALAWALHAAMRDLIFLATETGGLLGPLPDAQNRGGRALRFWATLLMEVGLFLIVAFLLLGTWGLDRGDLLGTAERAWTGITIGKYTISVGDILVAILLFVVIASLIRLIQRNFAARLQEQTQLDVGVRHALVAGTGYIGFTLAALIAISAAGLNLSNLALIAGALSVGIGFGLQAIVNNFVSGLIMLIERPVKEGDWVQVDGHEGFVKKISVRATELVTFQKASVIIPNGTFITTSVVNWTHKDKSGRVEVGVGVAYGSDTDKVQEILLKAAAEHPKVLKNPEPYVLFMRFGDSSLDFELRCYIPSVEERLIVASDLRYAIDRAFRDEGVEIPFPQRDLHVRTLPDSAIFNTE